MSDTMAKLGAWAARLREAGDEGGARILEQAGATWNKETGAMSAEDIEEQKLRMELMRKQIEQIRHDMEAERRRYEQTERIAARQAAIGYRIMAGIAVALALIAVGFFTR